MRFLTLLGCLCWGLMNVSAWGQIPPRVLNGEVHRIALDIQAAMKDDPRLKGLKLQVGTFNGHGMLNDSNFGLRFEELFKQELAEFVDPKAELNLSGSYHFVVSEDAALKQQGVKVLRVVLQILKIGKEIKSFDFEINNSDQIMSAIGGTGRVNNDPKDSFKDRNERVQELLDKPSFDVKDKYLVTAPGIPELRMGITKKSTPGGMTTPVIPENDKGLAFVKIDRGDYYEIDLQNNCAHDVNATLTIDGLDVANQFAIDKDSTGKKIDWKGYHVPANSTVTIRGWLHTVKQSSKIKDNVFSFKIVELGQGAASAMNARGKIGVITVQYREACDPNGVLSRSFPANETAKGEGLQEKLEAKQLQIGGNVLSTISIRYNR
jgi:hypothetical protein